MSLSPREKRAAIYLMKGPVMREELDRAIGASNGPDVIFRLRNKGIGIHCERIPSRDRYGAPCYPGRYSYTTDGKCLAKKLLSGAAATTPAKDVQDEK
jgi:hypothetical protein